MYNVNKSIELDVKKHICYLYFGPLKIKYPALYVKFVFERYSEWHEIFVRYTKLLMIAKTKKFESVTKIATITSQN